MTYIFTSFQPYLNPFALHHLTWLLQHIKHTAGIHSFFASVTQAARMEAGHELCWWETGAMCERRYRIGEQWFHLRPRHRASNRIGSQQFSFCLERDRGTINARELLIKCTSYAHYIASRVWARECTMLPVLVCIAQERHMQRVAEKRIGRTPGLILWTTTEVLLPDQGPLAPIWLQSMPQRSQVSQPVGQQRLCLFEARVY